MAIDASAVLQTAIIGHLARHGALAKAFGGRLHDRRPEAQAFPHLTVGLSEARDNGSKTRDGQIHLVAVAVWSRYRGRAQAKTLLAQVAAALHRTPLDLGPDFLWVNARVQSVAVLDEPDGVTTRGILTLKVVTESAESFN